jgi:hypothetical protein
MRAKAMPGEDPETLPHPADVAAKIVQLADPALTITGQLYDVRQDKFLHYHMPS